jgi:hypothetical protein
LAVATACQGEGFPDVSPDLRRPAWVDYALGHLGREGSPTSLPAVQAASAGGDSADDSASVRAGPAVACGVSRGAGSDLSGGAGRCGRRSWQPVHPTKQALLILQAAVLARLRLSMSIKPGSGSRVRLLYPVPGPWLSPRCRRPQQAKQRRTVPAPASEMPWS